MAADVSNNQSLAVLLADPAGCPGCWRCLLPVAVAAPRAMARSPPPPPPERCPLSPAASHPPPPIPQPPPHTSLATAGVSGSVGASSTTSIFGVEPAAAPFPQRAGLLDTADINGAPTSQRHGAARARRGGGGGGAGGGARRVGRPGAGDEAHLGRSAQDLRRRVRKHKATMSSRPGVEGDSPRRLARPLRYGFTELVDGHTATYRELHYDKLSSADIEGAAPPRDVSEYAATRRRVLSCVGQQAASSQAGVAAPPSQYRPSWVPDSMPRSEIQTAGRRHFAPRDGAGGWWPA
jgi:hypothetical protein